MNNSDAHRDPLPLDAYLDGTLPKAEREKVAQQINAHPELKAAVELQQRIDGTLRQSFTAPSAPANLLAMLQKSAAQSPPAPTPAAKPARPSWLKLALAGTAVAVVWGVIGWKYIFPSRPAAPQYQTASLATVYKNTVAAGFKPDWVCADDQQFANTFKQRLGQGLLLAAMPEGTKMEGLSYTNGLSQNGTTMLARVDDKPVMVFIDQTGCDAPHPTDPDPSTGLHLFHQELGPLVMYEVTPLDHPAVMQYFRLADVPTNK